MNVGIKISVVSDTATPAIQAQMRELTPARFAGRVGPKVADLVMEHLGALGPNQQGYPTTHFWEKFARNVRWLPTETGVVIAILPAIVNGRQVGLRQAVFGGTIFPQTVSFLAIPISPVSYGHVPSDFPGLFVIKTPRGAYLCQYGNGISEKTGRRVGRRELGGNAGRRLRADLNFLFKLASSVTQAGNRNVLPSDEQILQTATSAAGGKN